MKLLDTQLPPHELDLEDESDLQYVTRQKLDKLDWLKDIPKEKLLKLCMQVCADCMSPSSDNGGFRENGPNRGNRESDVK